MPSGKRHYRITLADALSAHTRALSLGGKEGIPNLGMVQSAIARPYSGYYLRIERKSAALVQSLATNHGFADGNKRTTVILLHTLLAKSDYELTTLNCDVSLDDAVEQMILDVVNRQISMDELIEWFKKRLRRPRQ